MALDKTYEFTVLLGIGSDTHDVLGRLYTTDSCTEPTCELPAARNVWGDAFYKWLQHSRQAIAQLITETFPPKTARSARFGDQTALETDLPTIADSLVGDTELPYPHFSSKTVKGKPLHTWALEDRLDEIEIPTKQSTIYSLTFDRLETLSRTEVCEQALAKINLLPEVTGERKALGNDFRRADIRTDWENIENDDSLPDHYDIAHFTCHCSSGTYMRTLAKLIGERLDPPLPSLAWSIHRSSINI